MLGVTVCVLVCCDSQLSACMCLHIVDPMQLASAVNVGCMTCLDLLV